MKQSRASQKGTAIRLELSCMRELTDKRAEELGKYIIDTGSTVRAAAKVFGISKSTVHTAVTKRNGLCGW